MKVRLYLKDSPIIREFEVKSHWHEGNMLYFHLTEKNIIRMYPMMHVWRMDVPNENAVVKEDNDEGR